ncbi:phosphoglycolate phosphatase-like HAD superfamily hydrolase [Pseudomonas sp. 2848]|jgi:phosphoglycolate phosphatase-like HAD superfamily hydrolase|uniref:HAD family hydrolase n=1 Tax=Pseudomonas sp. 2848 TaxID=2183926 RepID=UPI000DAF0281|nr:HAD family hydrolase [Pseudomonas sp. 2848]PZW86980.1 phosphoglycolate phosphatase-like HAD superfamily hydrolase [Pseudomonas sp. 2848]
MTVDPRGYATLVFDCDGVILDSNKVKTEAFYKAALPYGDNAARQLVSHHTQNGGISRFKKFQYLLDNLVAPGTPGPDLETLLASYAREVRDGLMSCAITPGLHELRARTPKARWLIVSGGAQAELRDVFEARGLAELFDGGIYGSPDSKEDILAREMACQNIVQPALFLGDSRYDHVASSAHGLDFVFIAGWSEFQGWQAYCQAHQLAVVATVVALNA